jgi:ABC-type bacteriocin/lantibiotic exporter with double-glycine peptidase domain
MDTPPDDTSSQPDEPVAALDLEPLIDALEVLCGAAQVDADRRAVRTALEEATKSQSYDGSDDWSTILQYTGALLGLDVQSFRCSASELARGFGRRQLPAVTLRSSDGDVVAALEHRGSRVRVRAAPGGHAGRWMSQSVLAQALETEEGAAHPWVFADAARPMDAISSQHGGHPRPMQRLVGLMRLESDQAGVAVVYAIGVGIMSLGAPLGVQVLVNTVAFGGLVQPLVVLTLLVFGAISLASLLRALQTRVVESVQQRLFVRAALDVTNRLPRARLDAFDQTHGPELVNRFFDVLTVQKGAATLLLDGVGVALSVLVGTLILAFYHPFLLVLDIVLIGVVALTIAAFGKKATESSIQESHAKYAVVAWLEEIARHPVSFRSAGGSSYAEARGKELAADYVHARQRHFTNLFRQIVIFLGLQAVATAALLGIGGWLVMRGKITLGQLVAAELIVTTVVAGFAKLGKYLESVYDLLAAVDKIGHLIDLPLEPRRGRPLRPSSKGARVRMTAVSFGYPNAKILDNVNLDLEPGARVAVIGPNGSGKSSLADLIYALRAPSAGSIELDGEPVRDLDRVSLREQVALVRGVEIFEGSIADNVRMGRALMHAGDVRRALEQVGLWETVSALPEGMETKLLTGGTRLSAGEARRLVLARAIASKPRLLMLDEALDDLDPTTREEVSLMLSSPDAPWTVLVTTHDRKALRGCDRVYCLHDGTLRPQCDQDREES